MLICVFFSQAIRTVVHVMAVAFEDLFYSSGAVIFMLSLQVLLAHVSVCEESLSKLVSLAHLVGSQWFEFPHPHLRPLLFCRLLRLGRWHLEGSLEVLHSF